MWASVSEGLGFKSLLCTGSWASLSTVRFHFLLCKMGILISSPVERIKRGNVQQGTLTGYPAPNRNSVHFPPNLLSLPVGLFLPVGTGDP